MQSNGESIDPGVGDVITVKDHVAAQLIRRGFAEPEDDTVPPLSNYNPTFKGKAATTRREPSFEAELNITTPDGTRYTASNDIPIAVMRIDEGVR